MSPKQYLDAYRNLTVKLVNGQVLFHIDIHEYRNASSPPGDHDVSAGMKGWHGLLKVIKKHGKQHGHGVWNVTYPAAANGTPLTELLNTKTMSRAFVGKGTPETISLTLRAAAGLDLIGSTSAAMNDFCSDTIGLDCSGFVGNYLTEEKLDANAWKKGSHEFAPVNLRIEKLDDIRDRSVIVWKDHGHVAIIDRVEPACQADGTVHAWVTESCGSQLHAGDIHSDGLNYTMYVFHSVDKHKVFQVVRGIGGHKKNHVYVANY